MAKNNKIIDRLITVPEVRLYFFSVIYLHLLLNRTISLTRKIPMKVIIIDRDKEEDQEMWLDEVDLSIGKMWAWYSKGGFKDVKFLIGKISE